MCMPFVLLLLRGMEVCTGNFRNRKHYLYNLEHYYVVVGYNVQQYLIESGLSMSLSTVAKLCMTFSSAIFNAIIRYRCLLGCQNDSSMKCFWTLSAIRWRSEWRIPPLIFDSNGPWRPTKSDVRLGLKWSLAST